MIRSGKPKPRYSCKTCGYDEITARTIGCGEPSPRFTACPRERNGVVVVEQVRVTACPMELASWFDRFLYYRLGILRK